MTRKYATKLDDKMAIAQLRNAPISPRHSIEIASAIRGRYTKTAKQLLTDVIAKKRPIRFNRYNDNVGHKVGGGPGRYPVKAAQHMLVLINSVEANANNKGLSTTNLKISAVVVNKAASRPKYGRQTGRSSKNTHVEIVVVPAKAPAKTSKKSTQTTTKEPTTQSVQEKTNTPKTQTTTAPKDTPKDTPTDKNTQTTKTPTPTQKTAQSQTTQKKDDAQ